jgi:hypothetical protein
MINKSKALILGIAALSTLGLVGCGKTTSSSKSDTAAPADETPAFVATEAKAGKMLFYFKWDEANAGAGNTAIKIDEIPSYVSPYLTGSFDADTSGTKPTWNTLNKAVELKRYEKTNYFYASIDWTYDPTKYPAGNEDPLAYQIVLGYNSTSGLTDYGLKWVDDYKSVQCAGYAYPTNPVYTFSADKLSVNLGAHDFIHIQPEPVKLDNYTRKFKIENVPSYVTLCLAGGNNSWDTSLAEATKLVKTAEADTFSFNFGTQVAHSTIEYKIVAINSKSTKDSFWAFEGTYTGARSKTLEDGTYDPQSNPVMAVLALDDIDEVITTWSFTKFPADPAAATYDVTINLKAPTDYATWSDDTHAAGSVKSIWANSSLNGWTAVLMTLTEGVYSYKYTGVAANSYELGFIMSDSETVKNQIAWVSGTDKNNIPVVVTETATTFTYEGSIAAGFSVAA